MSFELVDPTIGNIVDAITASTKDARFTIETYSNGALGQARRLNAVALTEGNLVLVLRQGRTEIILGKV